MSQSTLSTFSLKVTRTTSTSARLLKRLPASPNRIGKLHTTSACLEESDGQIRYAFFFHYLDFMKPLITPAGSLSLPKPTSKPAQLKDIEYE